MLNQCWYGSILNSVFKKKKKILVSTDSCYFHIRIKTAMVLNNYLKTIESHSVDAVHLWIRLTNCPLVSLSVCPSSIVPSIFHLHFVFRSPRVSLCKGCAVTSNQVNGHIPSRSMCNILVRSYITSRWSSLGYTSPGECHCLKGVH